MVTLTFMSARLPTNSSTMQGPLVHKLALQICIGLVLLTTPMDCQVYRSNVKAAMSLYII